MVEANIKIEGADVLRRNLRKLGKDLPKGMKLIHAEIAGPVAAVARRKARRKSGAMAAGVKVSATTTMSRIQAGTGQAREYTGVQHWGWPGHSISPNQFLTEAIEEKTTETLTLYEKKLGDWIDSVWDDTR